MWSKPSFLLLSAAAITSPVAAKVYGDRWNYDHTLNSTDGFTDFGPPQWGDIKCNVSTRAGLEACLGYTDKWLTGRGWRIEKNYCQWCPATEPGVCGIHHMSPINLHRDPTVACIDRHWMKYEDAWCPLDQMIATNSFLIERHALRIRQPITVEPDNSLFINCSVPGKGKRFGRIDFSEGFSQWWFLSHIDIHVPSEHTQEGKRYDAELQMHHFYSVNATVAGVDNQLGTVSTWLQSYDDVPPWRVLDMLICLWRQNEFETRQACGLHPIKGTYPGCFPLTGRKLRQQTNTESQENTEDDKKGKLSFETVQDLILAHHMRRNEIEQGILDEATAPELPKLQMEESNWGPPEKTDEEWAEFIANESTRMAEDEQLWQELHQEFDGDVDKAHEQFHARRKLIQGADLIWFNYFAMLAVRTEYYYRLTGSQTIPPCYGDFLYGTRAGDNNWRVMKDPIRIHPRQLVEMQRLIKERIAPKNAPLMACQPDTAAKIMSDGAPDTARPLQYESPAHNLVFCECPNWPSKWPEDRAWCRIQNLTDRLYDHPYNFETNGF